MSIIDRVEKKLTAGERLTDEDALALYECPDLLAIGKLADEVNRRKNGDWVFYNVNRHINPTNICVMSCKFCAYSRKPGEEGAYAYDIDEMVKKAGEAVAQGATEVHMVGGLHPRWKFSHYKDMIRAIKTAYPDLHLKAFTVVELDWMARKERRPIGAILEELREAGLGSLPGGGAEIFHPEIRNIICDTKVSAEQWLETHKLAHGLGMASNCTMLYGHIERFEHRIDHMRRLRELQDETRGFNAFIPLAFQPFQNEMGIDRYTFGYDDLKTIAVARLYMDNFRHVKAYWIMLGQDIAQLALRFGANDIDGTVVEEKISRMAGGRAGVGVTRPFLKDLIRKAGCTPVERDTLYRPLDAPERQGATAAQDEGLAAAMQRLAYGQAPTEADLLLVAREASLHDSGQLAFGVDGNDTGSFAVTIQPKVATEATVGEQVRKMTEAQTASFERTGIRPTVVALDLASLRDESQEIDLGRLVEEIWAYRQMDGGLEVSLQGLKSLWSLAQRENVGVADLLQRLTEAGVSVFESSMHETETDLTHSEVLELHREIISRELPTVAKAEISAPTKGSAAPHWESFVKRLLALRELAEEAQGLLLGVSVEASLGSFVTPTEYLRGVAIARLALPSRVRIIAPVASMPILSQRTGIGSRHYQDPAEKVAPLALAFGASDLGHLPVDRFHPAEVAREIRAAAFRPVLRDATFHTPAGQPRNLQELAEGANGGERHVPILRDEPKGGTRFH